MFSSLRPASPGSEMFSWRKLPSAQPACPNVLTPDRIPSFFIPPNLATLQSQRSQRSEASGTCGGPATPAGERSVQVTTSSAEDGEQALGRLYSASSMPQLSGPVGFVFLPESPHTRRRESLFHGERMPRCFHGSRFSSAPARPLSQSGLALDSDTASSTETSPYGSPLLMRALGSPLSYCAYGSRRRYAGRSATLSPAARPRSLSAEETSSTDTSPSFPRRETGPAWGCPDASSLVPLFPLDSIQCRERITKEMLLTVSKGGLLRLSSEFLPSQGRLRVRLVSAEGFYPAHCDPRHISCCVSMQLRPGLGQRQRSAIIKRSRNPIFNEDFFFEALSPEELPRHSLKLKVLNKGSGVRRDAVLGQCDVPLDSLLP